MQILLILIACLGPVIAVIFGCHGLWRWMADLYSAPVASAILAGVWLGIASLAAITTLILRARSERRKAAINAAAAARAPTTSGLGAVLSGLPGDLGEGLPLALATLELAMKKKPIQTTAILIGFGAILGRQPGSILRMARMAAAQ
ncbi:hypothetical protein ACWCOP_14535 [Maricaulaceae bacterium MS644]